ncbi:hypothetical protein B1759_02905 [Rubrivirga sp. SAORIC476]|nr:hypothetical protein B1759_02905 [Rubrivirga sp. SAORIC476]
MGGMGGTGATADAVSVAEWGSRPTAHVGPTPSSSGSSSRAAKAAAQTPCRAEAGAWRRRRTTRAASSRTSAPLSAMARRRVIGPGRERVG